MKVNWKEFLAQHDVIYEMQSRTWQDGTPLGNGSLAALAFEPHHLEWTINKNDVWDYRHPQFKRHSTKYMRKIVSNDLDYREEMCKENGAGLGRYPSPKSCGQLRIRFGFDSIYAPAHRIRKRLSLYEGTLYTRLDKHLSHPRVTSFIHPTENVMVIQVRDVSAATAFHNKVDLFRVPDSEMPEVRYGASGDRIWLEQRFYADAANQRLGPFCYVLMARIVPRGAHAYQEVFKRTVQEKWWHVIEPSKTITSQVEGQYAVANVAGDFDVFVTVITSLESKNPLMLTKRRLIASGKQGSAKLHADHRRWWAKYWPKNYVGVKEPLLEQLWYVSQYNLATVLPGVPVGALCGLWFGPIETPSQILPWMGHYTNDYNAQLPVMPVFRLNRPELADGPFRTLLNMLPQAKQNARELYELSGAYYPLATDPTGTEVTNGPYRFCQNSGPYWSVFLWWHYLYTGDKDYLRRITYPIMREVARFFAQYMVWHDKEQLYHLEISQNPELFYVKYPDPVDTLALLKYTLRAAIEAARILKRDSKLAQKWQHVLDHYPPYPRHENEISPLRGLRPNHLNHRRTLATVFPCAEFNSPSETDWENLCRAELKRTDFWDKNYGCNKGRIGDCGTGVVYHNGLAACRLGMKEMAWNYLTDLLKVNVKPNGLISHNSAVLVDTKRSEKNIGNIPNAEIYTDYDPDPMKAVELLSGRLMENATENLDCRDTIFPALEGPACYLLLMGEILLQSHNGILHIFPILPNEIDATFADLRAEGPTLVSAARENGKIRFVRLKAIAPVTWKLKNPWTTAAVWLRSNHSKQVRTIRGDENIVIALDRGEEVIVTDRKSKKRPQIQPRSNQIAQPRCMKFSDGMLCWLGKPQPSAYYTALEKARLGEAD